MLILIFATEVNLVYFDLTEEWRIITIPRSLMRCSMHQAVFCVIFKSRCSLIELTPLRLADIRYMEIAHFW